MTSLVVGLVGTKGVGKTTIALHLVSIGFTDVSFADVLKDSVCLLLGLRRHVFDDPRTKEQPIHGVLSPREIMQKYGDLVKTLFGPDIFIDTIRRKLATIGTPVVISDIRFPAEEVFVRTLGAQVYRVLRSTRTRINHNDPMVDNGPVHDLHESESKQHLIRCDHVIYNDCTNRGILHMVLDDEFRSVENRCTKCNVDMGPCNPRQLCGKTKCDNLPDWDDYDSDISSGSNNFS